ncbi:MAG: hypothetical protein WKG01_16400 [Kofleriaceae bacterium]
MFRFAPFALLAACITDPTPAPDPETATRELAATAAFSRAHVTGDIYHYELVLPVGDGPNAALRIHRVVREIAPYIPRATRGGAMLLHGDFSTFESSFLPGLASYLASRELDVWGLDRRWTIPGADDDISDLATMGVAQEIDDTRAALAFARAVRGVSGAGADKLALVGFSHGAQLAYAYAAVEAGRPAAQRHVDAIVPLDFYASLPPEEDAFRQTFCESSAFVYDLVAAGEIDFPNQFQIDVGTLALTAPDEVSPINPSFTNRTFMLRFIGQTYRIAPFTPLYHLGAPILEGGAVVGLRESSETAMATWLADATVHQPLLEAADLDRLLCGEGTQPVNAPLSQIRVPVFYVGAAGGIGALGLDATTRVSSTDVTTLIVQRFGPDRVAEDFGHTDLLFGNDAQALAWQPIASWLLHH